MTNVIKANGVSKHYGKFVAVDNLSFEIGSGKIIGLVGPNGAGKTSLINAMLGLTDFDGDLKVLGFDPKSQRHEMMQKVSFIADVAILPKWIKVKDLIDYVEGVHPNFSREKVNYFLSKTKINVCSKVKELSKGMEAQLHLALIMSIDAELLVLDEPTLGLDILYRKEFYHQLLTEYFDENKTILVTTHQIEEIEHILTDIMFIRDGKIILNETMDDLAEQYVEVMVNKENFEKAEALKPVSQREIFGRRVYLFEGVSPAELEALGETNTPGVADLFVAKMKENF
ncbi:MAG: ABC transporter ATP-binding protein [Gammaproteobacteria bacterium]|nr:ABC transporter ATP-binding protein [Gammaproteobacteria bacterium]MDH5629501.1 ABC transporter ATP-binding protein [Gammaproteobacteria bacterium]